MESVLTKNFAIKFSGILLILIPFTLLTGNFIPDTSIVIISLIFLFFTLKESDYKYYNNYFFFLFIIFYIFICCLSFISKNPIESLPSSLTYLRFGIFALAVFYLLEKDKSLSKKFTIFFLFSFIFALIDGYYQFFFDKSIFNFVALSPNRMVLPLNDKMYLGGYLSRMFPFLIALLIYNFEPSKKNIFIGCLLLILTDVLVFITGERTALGLMIISTILLIFLLSKFQLFRLITFITSIIIIFTISIYNPEIRERNIDYTIQQLDFLNNDLEPSENDSKINKFKIPKVFSIEHEHIYLSSYKMFNNNYFTGIGPNLFRYHCDDPLYYSGRYTCSTHPHNNYVQLAAETGMLGLISLFLIFFYLSTLFIKIIIRRILKLKIRIDDYRICLMIAIFISVWPFLPTQNFFNGYINIIYYLPVGFILHSIYTRY